MATSSSALALTRTRNGHRRRLIVVGGVLIAAAAIVVASLVALNLAGARTVPFDVDHAPIIQEQLHQHLLRENAAAPETQPARGNASTMLHQHLLRENGSSL